MVDKMNKTKYVPVRLSEKDFQKLTDLSSELKLSKSEVIRRTLERMFEIKEF